MYNGYTICTTSIFIGIIAWSPVVGAALYGFDEVISHGHAVAILGKLKASSSFLFIPGIAR